MIDVSSSFLSHVYMFAHRGPPEPRSCSMHGWNRSPRRGCHTRRVIEQLAASARQAVGGLLPLELQARLAGTSHPTAAQVPLPDRCGWSWSKGNIKCLK